ncbi:hypothetical protein BHE74_00028738 [Ensete ventricosum]|nr:hypothetical protein GW17_00055044 [Ensete ventricosum]RWW64050.1 hypothetical protein BHE74_00028738 [Ensete ventricosum]
MWLSDIASCYKSIHYQGSLSTRQRIRTCSETDTRNIKEGNNLSVTPTDEKYATTKLEHFDLDLCSVVDFAWPLHASYHHPDTGTYFVKLQKLSELVYLLQPTDQTASPWARRTAQKQALVGRVPKGKKKSVIRAAIRSAAAS